MESKVDLISRKRLNPSKQPGQSSLELWRRSESRLEMPRTSGIDGMKRRSKNDVQVYARMRVNPKEVGFPSKSKLLGNTFIMA